jgi:dipeptidyl aminopeptidase/acylaminoacyl peptidase
MPCRPSFQRRPSSPRSQSSSPKQTACRSTRRLFPIHGDDDRNVPFHPSVDLAEALRARGVTVEQLVFPDEAHDFLVQAYWIGAYRAAMDFLERNLKK